MYIPGDPLPTQWQVVLKDGSAICVWAGMYGEEDGYYTFDVLAEASPEEQADSHLVINGHAPANPERIVFTVAKVPVDLVASIWSRDWDTPVEPADLAPAERDRPRSRS
jgi:hypothetical protein